MKKETSSISREMKFSRKNTLQIESRRRTTILLIPYSKKPKAMKTNSEKAYRESMPYSFLLRTQKTRRFLSLSSLIFWTRSVTLQEKSSSTIIWDICISRTSIRDGLTTWISLMSWGMLLLSWVMLRRILLLSIRTQLPMPSTICLRQLQKLYVKLQSLWDSKYRDLDQWRELLRNSRRTT